MVVWAIVVVSEYVTVMVSCVFAVEVCEQVANQLTNFLPVAAVTVATVVPGVVFVLDPDEMVGVPVRENTIRHRCSSTPDNDND